MSRLFSLSCHIAVINFRHHEKLSVSENKANPAVLDRILCNTSLRHNLQVDVNFFHWCFMLIGRSYEYQLDKK